ncbi:MAG: hydroxymethylglutaryl-CoA reductase, degradative, partial [Candidatus Hydrothermarchaeaceae archaeon]
MKSRISGFYKLTPEERMEIVKEFADLSDEEAEAIQSTGALSTAKADKMIENVIGTVEIPLGIATNFKINGRDYLIPMATEEPSVVAAASNAARIARVRGGFRATSTEPGMIGQIQVTNLKNAAKAGRKILANKKKILELANKQDAILVKLGGGAKDLEARLINTQAGKMLILHLIIDCRDAMGATVVNTMTEAVAPLVEELTEGRVYLRIVSNLAVYRLARASAVFDKKAVGGSEVVDGILRAHAFAAADKYRCTTHNKGIMNGVTAVALATGNDTRAVEAGAHAYASISGNYQPLTKYRKNRRGDLAGEIEFPVAVGIVGGNTSVNPVARASLKIIGAKSAGELGEVMASVGLAQNFAALRALASEGIQRGHMA